MTAMTLQAFEQWLKRYGEAWVAGDPDAVVELFSPNAAYHETPFDPPMVGAGAIRQYWTDGAKNAQTHVRFEATPASVNGRTGYAQWHATFERVPSGVSSNSTACSRRRSMTTCAAMSSESGGIVAKVEAPQLSTRRGTGRQTRGRCKVPGDERGTRWRAPLVYRRPCVGGTAECGG
jgi:ketosteroid isomerase-like protein